MYQAAADKPWCEHAHYAPFASRSRHVTTHKTSACAAIEAPSIAESEVRTRTAAHVDPGSMREGFILCQVLLRKLHQAVSLWPGYEHTRTNRQSHVMPVLDADKVLQGHSLLYSIDFGP